MPGFVYGSNERYDAHNDGETAPMGLHRAQCSGVSEVFQYQSKLYGEKNAVRVEWTLADKFDSKGRAFVVSKRYNVKLDKSGNIIIDTRSDTKQSLGKDIQTWKPSIKSDLSDLLGQACQVLVMHKPKENGGVFANVQAVMPAMEPTSASNSKTEEPLPF